jgi:hypothetical protein
LKIEAEEEGRKEREGKKGSRLEGERVNHIKAHNNHELYRMLFIPPPLSLFSCCPHSLERKKKIISFLRRIKKN